MTNIENLSKETIDGLDPRTMFLNGNVYLCVSDIYKQLDVPQQTISSIIKRHSSEFEPYVVKVNGNDLYEWDVKHNCNMQFGYQRGTIYLFIDESGFNLLAQKIDASVVFDIEKRESLLKRQSGMAEVFTKYRRKEVIDSKTVAPTIHPAMRSPEQIAKDKIDLGVYIADIFNLPKQMMVSMGLAEASKETGVSFEKYQKCLPPASGSYACAHISARDIGKPYGDDGRRVNKLLAKLGYIYKVGKSWELTNEGKEMGGDYFHFTNEINEHKGIYIQWPETIREIVEKHKDML
jgi:hypothetical protein